ncbi:TolC family protein [candidate division WOR-3 bacterium]|nr:TolC family protein [candidate division WOR-3 bacterium]
MIVFFLIAQLPIDSLSLDQVIDSALARSPVYYESKLSLDKARISYYQALSNLLPTFSSTATYTHSTYHDITNETYTGTLALNQPLLDLDIISSALIARKTLTGTRLQHEAEIAQLLLRLKTGYYNLINAYELLTSSEIAIKRAQENLKLIQAKYELGAASRLEKLQGEVFLLRAQSDLAQARKLMVTANEDLKAMIGSTHDIYPVDSLSFPDSMSFPSLDSLTAVLSQVNYAVRMAQQTRSAAYYDVVASYLALLPRISFFYGYTYNSDSLVFDFQYMEDNTSTNYGISVSIPIFELKTLLFRNWKARKEFKKQTYAEQRIMYETQKTLRTTYASLLEAFEKVQLSDKSLDAATEAASIAKEQYTLGLISFLDYVSSEKDLYEAHVSYTSALSDFHVQRATLSYLLASLSQVKE